MSLPLCQRRTIGYPRSQKRHGQLRRNVVWKIAPGRELATMPYPVQTQSHACHHKRTSCIIDDAIYHRNKGGKNQLSLERRAHVLTLKPSAIQLAYEWNRTVNVNTYKLKVHVQSDKFRRIPRPFLRSDGQQVLVL